MSAQAFDAGVLGALIAVLATCVLVVIVGTAREYRRTRYMRGWRVPPPSPNCDRSRDCGWWT